jgi:hypothetical protein
MSEVLAEVLADKWYLDQKIDELKVAIARKPNDNLVQELLALIELRQARRLSIAAANNTSVIRLGETEVTINVAIEIRNTIKEKMDILTSMIANEDSGLDILTLQKQRDKYQREYSLITLGITNNDLKVTLG